MNLSLVWLFSHGTVADQQIQIIENQLQIQFPEDYILCARQYHGGHPNLEVYDFAEHLETVFDRLLSFDPTRSNYLLKVYQEVRDRIPDGIYPFASDPFGNLLCFKYQNNGDRSPTVVFWEHELAHLDPDRAVFFVTSTFSELLSKLYIP